MVLLWEEAEVQYSGNPVIVVYTDNLNIVQSNQCLFVIAAFSLNLQQI